MNPGLRSLAPGVVLACVMAATVACARKPVPEVPAAMRATGCLATGEGRLEAELRGAINADIDWNNAQMECDGGPRPDGSGLRIAIVGALDAQRKVRFIFGVDLADVAEGPAQVHPTNLTVIIEDEAQLYATRGDDKCAVESLGRVPLQAGQERVSARGYCIGPAADMSGGAPLHLPTFAFTALVREEPVDEAGLP